MPVATTRPRAAAVGHRAYPCRPCCGGRRAAGRTSASAASACRPAAIRRSARIRRCASERPRSGAGRPARCCRLPAAPRRRAPVAAASTVARSPSRTTRACGAAICFSAAIARSARYSCTKPMTRVEHHDDHDGDVSCGSPITPDDDRGGDQHQDHEVGELGRPACALASAGAARQGGSDRAGQAAARHRRPRGRDRPRSTAPRSRRAARGCAMRAGARRRRPARARGSRRVPVSGHSPCR